MYPKTSRFKLAYGFAIILVSLIQVACDPNQTDLGEASALDAETPVPSTPPETMATDAVAQAGKTTTAIAPGNIVLLALSAYDARAVVKSAQGEMQAMKLGDTVLGTQATLVDILDDRLVFEEFVTKPSGLKTQQTVWVYKAKDGVSRIQVLHRHGPKSRTYAVEKTISRLNGENFDSNKVVPIYGQN